MSIHNKLILNALLLMIISTCAAAQQSIITTSQVAGVPGRTHLTQEQAISIAKTFSQKFSASAIMNGTAQYTVPDQSLGSSDHHWQARWNVTFPHQAEVEVIDATGVVAFYDNLNYIAKDPSVGNQPAGQAIPKEEAIIRAVGLLKATGQIGELAFWKADLDQTTDPPSVLGHTWFICWTREFQGIPYEHEGLNITLDAETGEIRSLGLIFHSAPPKTASINLNQEAAQQTALALLRRSGVESPQFNGCKRLVVQPNTYWQVVNESVSTMPQTARPVWSCSYIVGSRVYKVCIDTETGKVIGGSTSLQKVGDPVSLMFSKPLSSP